MILPNLNGLPVSVFWATRGVFPHKEATSSLVMFGLMSETRRGWHEEKTRKKST